MILKMKSEFNQIITFSVVLLILSISGCNSIALESTEIPTNPSQEQILTITDTATPTPVRQTPTQVDLEATFMPTATYYLHIDLDKYKTPAASIELAPAIVDIESAKIELPGRISYIVRGDDTTQLMVIEKDLSTREISSEYGDIVAYWWSPDGSKIVLLVYDEDSRKLIVANSYGRNPVLLQEDDMSCATDLDWSPDGEKVLWVTDSYIYLGNKSGDNVSRLVQDIDGCDIFGVDWSPTTDEILLAKYILPIDTEIFLLNLNQNRIDRITYDEANSHHPLWSPDGEKIMYRAQDEWRSTSYIYISTLQTIETKGIGIGPVMWPMGWAPDGERIMYREEWDRSCIYDFLTEENFCLADKDFTIVDWAPNPELLLVHKVDDQSALFFWDMETNQAYQVTDYSHQESDYFGHGIENAQWVPDE
jgi:Tol biopolymer transport system component